MTRQPHSAHLILLLLIVVFAGVLRWFGVSIVGYWTDELCALSAAQGRGLELYKVPLNTIIPPLPVTTRLRDAMPIWEIPGAVARDETHPPVYSLLLRFWEELFGDNEAGTRSLNICFSLIAIVLLYVAAKASVGSATALWAALLMAVASPQIMFSLETRDYMPTVAFALAATVAFIRIGQKPSTIAAACFGLMLLLMMLTHYYGAGIAAALVLHAILWMRGQSRRLVIVAAVVAGGLFLVIWGRYFIQELPNFKTNTAWLFDISPGRLQRWALRLCRAPGMLVAADLPDGSAILGLLFLLLPIGYLRRPELRLWILWLVCTIGLIAGQDLLHSTTQLGLPRYLLFATPAAYVLLAAMIRGRWRWLPPAAAGLIALLSLRSAYLPAWKLDLRTPVNDYVAPGLSSEDGIVISGPDPIFDGIVYAAFQHYLPKMPAVTAVLTKPADAATLDRLRQCRRVWLLWMWTDRPVRQMLPGYVAPALEDRGHIPYFGDLMRGRVLSPSSENAGEKH